jgi:hypothetical protein
MLHYNIFLKNFWESQEDEFAYVKYQEHFSTEEPCNIYLVGIRPRVVIDPSFFEIQEDTIKLKFLIQNKFSFEDAYVFLRLNRKIEGQFEIETSFPFSRFNFKDDKGYFYEIEQEGKLMRKGFKGKSFYALRNLLTEYDTRINDLELLYIGKSLKMDKSISPVKRLKNHSNVQRILQKCTQEYSDKEVYIILCSFVKKISLLTLSDKLGKFKNHDDMMGKLNKNFQDLKANNELTTQIAEAALIDHFDTKEFNKDFIGTFGNKSHTYYPNIKKSEISTVSVELDLTELCRVFSKSVKPSAYHIIKFFPKHDFKKVNDTSFDESEMW